MKQKLFLAATIICLAMVACVDTEENIQINADDTGIYNLSMDMGSMMGQLQLIAMQQPDLMNALADKDTTIQFRQLTDTSSQLNDQEKKLLHNATMHLVINEENSKLHTAFQVPFTNLQELSYLKQHFVQILGRLKATDKALMGNSASGQNMAHAQDPSALLKPAAEAFTFSAAKGKITYSFADKNAFDALLGKDSSIQMIKQVMPLLGDARYKTVLTLPGAVKNYTGSNASVSADKKTITFNNTIQQLFQNPETLSYSVDY